MKDEPTSYFRDRAYQLDYPDHFPEPNIPDDNQLTELRVELGKKLFFDKRLSADGTISCGSCHFQELAFADSEPLSTGINNRIGKRNAPGLFNLAWKERFLADGGVPNLELQVMVPLHDEREMGSNILDIAPALDDIAVYAQLSRAAYDRPVDAFVITRAIAAFERSLVSGNSSYDQYLEGNEQALNDSEIRGMELFFSSRTNCSSCHSGPFFTDGGYHNVGLYKLYQDIGREGITLDPSDNGKFMTPSLRNIAHTAPYMHDGSIATLEEVIEHFDQGGTPHPIKDPQIEPLQLNEQEKLDLVNFLGSLSDADFLVNPDHRP